MKKNRVLPILVLLLLILVIGMSVVLKLQKDNLERDIQTIKDFASLYEQIIEFKEKAGTLPEKLNGFNNFKDSYEYIATDNSIFKLCADFSYPTNQEVLKSVSLNVDYQAGHSCIAFNALDKTIQVIKKTVPLSPVDAMINVNEQKSTTGNITININSDKNIVNYDASAEEYIINLYTTLKASDSCIATGNCCYKFEKVSASVKAVNAKYNRLGNADYVNPFAENATESFGDLPQNFCFNGSNEMSGGISFRFPENALTKTEFNTITLDLKLKDQEATPIYVELDFAKP